MFSKCKRDNEIVDLYINGTSAEEIGDIMGVGIDYVLDVLERAELV